MLSHNYLTMQMPYRFLTTSCSQIVTWSLHHDLRPPTQLHIINYYQWYIHQKAEMDVKTIMDTWTLQMGFPLVTIKRGKSSGKATATQKHFLLDPNANVTVSSPYE